MRTHLAHAGPVAGAAAAGVHGADLVDGARHLPRLLLLLLLLFPLALFWPACLTPACQPGRPAALPAGPCFFGPLSLARALFSAPRRRLSPSSVSSSRFQDAQAAEAE